MAHIDILAISAFYHDSTACLLRDGEIVAPRGPATDVPRARHRRVLCRSPVVLAAAALRSRLLAAGAGRPFDRRELGLEVIADPLARPAVRPFEAHREQSEAAWCLGALAVSPPARPGTPE